MTRRLTSLFISLFVLAVPMAAANGIPAPNNFSIYRNQLLVQPPALKIPTPVLLALPENQHYAVAVVEEGGWLPEYIIERKKSFSAKWTIEESSGFYGEKTGLFDDDLKTYSQFEVIPEEGAEGEVAFLKLKTAEAAAISRIALVLADNVTYPREVEVKGIVNGQEKILVARTNFWPQGWREISFPETKTDTLEMRIWHPQPLRILEMTIDSRNTGKDRHEIAWLAYPEKNYVAYLGAEALPRLNTKERNNITFEDKEIVVLAADAATLRDNPLYKAPDVDNDTVADRVDNCQAYANPDQKDDDGDGLGDACEDFDRDGYANAIDNCPSDANAGQSDQDGDGQGDICDSEEGRVTERLPWLPWVAIGFAGIVMGGIVWSTVLRSRKTRA